MKNSILALGALALLLAPPLHAQDATVLGAGTRVRLISARLDSSPQIGRIVSATRDTLAFRADGYPATRSLSVADISSIEIYAGKQSHRGRDALYGLAIGGSAGAIAGALSYKEPSQGCFIFCETRSGDAIAGGIVGGLAGTLIGAFVVGNFDKTERWVPLRKTASIRVTPVAGGARIALSARF